MGKSKPVILNDKTLKKHKLSVTEFITLLSLAHRVNPEDHFTDLVKKRYICENPHAKEGELPYYVTASGRNVLESIVTDVSADGITDEYITEVAQALQEVFPQGKKPGTSYYWRGSVSEIVIKLQGFYKRYGNNFTKEEMVAAAQRYVAFYNGSTTYMQLLKYFISKEKLNGERVSELASYLENKDEQDTATLDWTTTLK